MQSVAFPKHYVSVTAQEQFQLQQQMINTRYFILLQLLWRAIPGDLMLIPVISHALCFQWSLDFLRMPIFTGMLRILTGN